MSTNGKPLSKEDLLGMTESETTTHDVQGWGSVRLRYLSGLNRAELERLLNSKMPDPAKIRVRLLQMALANEDGTCLLDDGEARVLMGKRGTAIESLCDQILEMNGIGGEEVEEVKN